VKISEVKMSPKLAAQAQISETCM